jgi:hypothetical protein
MSDRTRIGTEQPITPPGVGPLTQQQINSPVVLAVVDAAEAQLGRTLTTVERAAIVHTVITQHAGRLAVANLDRPIPGADPLLTDGETQEIIDYALHPSVQAAIVNNLQTQSYRYVPSEENAPSIEEQVAAATGIDQASLTGLPSGLMDSVTGEQDVYGRPSAGTVDGIRMVWDAELQQAVPGLFLDTEEDKGPLPIGAEFLGITSPGDQLPTNLGEVQETFARDVAKYITDSDAESRYLGLGPNYQAPGPAPVHLPVQYGQPQYYPGDQWIDFATKSPAYQTQIQYALVEAGLMRSGDVAEGVWTIDAAKGVEVAMLMANSTGGAESWVSIVEDLAQGLADAGNRPGSGSGSGRRSPLAGRVLTLPAYVEPDYALLENQVRDAFSAQLRRKPTDWEMSLLAENLNTNYRAQYDEQIQGLKQEFEAGNRGILAGGPSVQASGSIEGIDPIARLRSQIEDKYSAEVNLNEDRASHRQDVANVFSILTQSQNVLSGGAQ